MKLSYVFLAPATVFLIACGSTKSTYHKPDAPAASTTPASAPSADASATEDLVKAAKAKWPDVTAETINQGKEIYTKGACVGCHGAKNIAHNSAEQWPGIIDRMARKAKIDDTQKDAVLKYVMAMKMTGH